MMASGQHVLAVYLESVQCCVKMGLHHLKGHKDYSVSMFLFLFIFLVIRCLYNYATYCCAFLLRSGVSAVQPPLIPL